MPKLPIFRRVVMARSVAERWLEDVSHPEYRLTVYLPGNDARNVPALMQGLKEGRIRVAGLTTPKDFGVAEAFDAITMWSSDGEAIKKLAKWFDDRDYETTGVR
jgi:hypothetical protein